MTYRNFEIPKKNGTRKISAPSEELLRYQRGKLHELNGALDYLTYLHNVTDVIHGFRNNHNCITAARQHIGYEVTLSMDISNFFFFFTREHFEYTDLNLPAQLFHAEGYTAQGFATSPILSNIAIIPALKEIQNYLTALGVKYSLTIYADDIQISTNLPDVEFQIFSLVAVVTAILKKYKFTVNSGKTRLAYAKYGYRKILGVNVGRESLEMTRKLKRKIRAARHQASHNPTAASSLGGLVTWSRMLLPKALR